MANGSLTGLLGICRKANRLKLGFDPVLQSLGKDARLIIFTSDISPKTRKRVLNAAKALETASITINETSDELWYALGKRVAVMAVTDSGLAESVLKLSRPAGEKAALNHDEEDTDL